MFFVVIVFAIVAFCPNTWAFTTFGNSGAVLFNGSYQINFRASGALVGPGPDCGISEVRNQFGALTKEICVYPPIKYLKVTHVNDMPQTVFGALAGVTVVRNLNVFQTDGPTLSDFLADSQVQAGLLAFKRQTRAHLMTTNDDNLFHLEAQSSSSTLEPGGGATEGRDCVPDPTNCQDTYYCAALKDPSDDVTTNLANPNSCASQFLARNPLAAGQAPYSQNFLYGSNGVCTACPIASLANPTAGGAPIQQVNSDGSPQTQSCYNLPGAYLCVPDQSEQSRPTCALVGGSEDCAGTNFIYSPLFTSWFFEDNSYQVYQNQDAGAAVTSQIQQLSEDFSQINDRLTSIGTFLSNATTWEGGIDTNWGNTNSFDKDWTTFTTSQTTNIVSLAQANLQTLADTGNLNSKTQQEFGNLFTQLNALNQDAINLFANAESMLNASQQAINVQAQQTAAISARLQQTKVDMGRWADSIRDSLEALETARMGRDFSRSLVQASFRLQGQMLADGYQMFLYGFPNSDGTFGQKPNPPVGASRFVAFERITAWSATVNPITGDSVIHMDQVLITCDNSYLQNSTYSWFVKRDIMRLLGSNTAVAQGLTGCVSWAPGVSDSIVSCICWASVVGQQCDMGGQTGIPVNLDVIGPTYVGSPGKWDTAMTLLSLQGCTNANGAYKQYPTQPCPSVPTAAPSTCPILTNTPLDSVAITMTNLANFSNWMTTICSRPVVNPGVSKIVVHSANLQRIWVLPRITSLCSSQYTDMALESAATNTSLTVSFVMTEMLSIAFKLFNLRRNSNERFFYGSLPQDGFEWLEQPFQQNYATKEASSVKSMTFVGVHPEMFPIYNVVPVAGTASESVVVTVKTLQPDGTWLLDTDAVSDLWITSTFAHLADTPFPIIGFLECIRNPCQVPILKPGFGGSVSVNDTRFVVNFPSRLYSSSPFPAGRIDAINYAQFNPIGVPQVTNKRPTPSLAQWHLDQGYDPTIAFIYNSDSASIDPMDYVTDVIAPLNNAKGYYCSFLRTSSGELCTIMDVIALDLTPPVGSNSADDLTLIPGYYRSWSVEGRLKWPESVITLQQPQSNCPPASCFSASNIVQSQLFVITNNSVNAPYGLELHTAPIFGSFPDCVSNLPFVLPPSSSQQLAPFAIPSCRTTSLALSITTANGAQTCWSWNATVYQVIIQPGRIETLAVQWQVQDSSAIMLAAAAADMGAILDDVSNLIIQSVIAFSNNYNESNVELRQAAFNKIAGISKTQFLAANQNLTNKIAADAKSSWTAGEQLGNWINTTYLAYAEKILALQAGFDTLPNGTQFTNALSAANNRSAYLLKLELADLALYLQIAHNFSTLFNLVGNSGPFNWAELGPAAFKCQASLQQILTSEPGVSGIQLLTNIQANRAAIIARRNQADCTVQGFLSAFNFACGNWGPFRITLWIEASFYVGLIIFLFLPGCGFNITAGAYVGCRCCYKNKHSEETVPLKTVATSTGLGISQGTPDSIEMEEWKPTVPFDFT